MGVDDYPALLYILGANLNEPSLLEVFSMISPEILRSYPFFGLFTHQQYNEVVMISQEVSFTAGEEILKEGQIAKDLYFLLEGGVELYFTFTDLTKKEILVGEINPGEPFGVSSLIYPYLLTSTVRASKVSRVIKIDAIPLRQLFEKDQQLGFVFMTRIAQAVIERLNITRILLAAERMSDSYLLNRPGSSINERR